MAAKTVTFQPKTPATNVPAAVATYLATQGATQKTSHTDINQMREAIIDHATTLDGLAGRPDIAQLTADFPSAGAGTATLRIIEAAFVGTLDFFASANVTGISYQKNGSPATLPVTVALNDIIIITATASAPGYVKLRRA